MMQVRARTCAAHMACPMPCGMCPMPCLLWLVACALWHVPCRIAGGVPRVTPIGVQCILVLDDSLRTGDWCLQEHYCIAYGIQQGTKVR